MTPPNEFGSGAAVQAGIDDLIAEIDDSLRLLSTGCEVDLSGFDRRVESICQAAQRLDGEGALGAAAALSDLVERLNQLTERLQQAQGHEAQRQEDRNGPDRSQRLRQANQAYRSRDPGRDPGTDDE
jgi:uncharacterized membrane protein YccC